VGKSASIGIEQQNKTQQVGPPWFDTAWNYRRPVIVTNNGASLGYYQVLLKLDSSNFDFTKSKPDGSDIRITGSDGTTEIKFWIESWSNPEPQVAYIWVRIFPLVHGTITIYLYYNTQLSVASESNGVATFDGFDNSWTNITGSSTLPEVSQLPQKSGAVQTQLSWTKISGAFTVNEGIISLGDWTGIKSTNSMQYGAVGFRANFGLGNGKEWGGFINGASAPHTMIGDLESNTYNLFLRNSASISEDQLLSRVGGNDWHNNFHIYEVRWKAGLSTGDIDHGKSIVSSTQSQAVPNTLLPVTFYRYTNIGDTLSVDWVYVRQYQDPEPTTSVGAEQGLVDLSLNTVDSPDPVSTKFDLTYLLNISNNSSIEAPGVIVTDTLPLSVQFLRASSSWGCNHNTNIVVCKLAPIAANSSASATIVVKPQADGVITDDTVVGSTGYENNLGNNFSTITTTVDSEPPVVEWILPVKNRELYDVNGGPVTLQVRAIDNLGIQRVEFKWYDADGNIWQPIGTVTAPSAPSIYQLTFNSLVLKPNVYIPIEVYVFDLAGNENILEPYSYRQIIFINRIFITHVYLPLMAK
jgi:uncharacterized repeat protein (TIGR01451 family)